MRITLVSSSSGSTGGGEIYLGYLAIGLLNLGHEVQAICSSTPGMDEWSESLSRICPVIRSDFVPTYDRRARSLGAALDVRQQARMRHVFQTCRADLLHVNQQVAEDGLDLLLAARGSGIPFLSTIHITHSASELDARFGGIRDWVTKKVLQRLCGAHITVAKSSRARLLDRFERLDPADVHVVQNGVPFPKHDSDVRKAAREIWGVGAKDIVLGSVGRLNPQKSPEFALEIVSALKRKNLPVRFIWIGDGAGRASFKHKAASLGIADLVHLDGWRDDVASCLLGLDILLMPSRFEGMPLALLEAMGAGLCCCVSAVDGMEEVIAHGRSGFLCTPGDLEQWVDEVEHLIHAPALRGETGRRARAEAQKRYSLDTMAVKTAEVYEDVRRRARGASPSKTALSNAAPSSSLGLF